MKRIFLAGISSLLLIACVKEEVAKDPATDPHCIAYFDGCNNCTKMQGGSLSACTKKYCAPEAMQEPYCIEFDKE